MISKLAWWRAVRSWSERPDQAEAERSQANKINFVAKRERLDQRRGSLRAVDYPRLSWRIADNLVLAELSDKGRFSMVNYQIGKMVTLTRPGNFHVHLKYGNTNKP